MQVSRNHATGIERHFGEYIPSNYKPNRPLAKRIKNFTKAYQSWFVPYLKSCVNGTSFHPLLSFLYTDLNCNLNCSYCFSRGRDIPGMPMEMARDAVDWLHARGCRVLAYMGGEPLVRPDFIIELTRYAVSKGFFVYLPTNGILMDKAFIEEIGRAGIATINLAVDCLEPRAGLVKALNRIEPQFEYLVEREKHYGYITFLNIKSHIVTALPRIITLTNRPWWNMRIIPTRIAVGGSPGTKSGKWMSWSTG